jgi:hypothetical protein
VTPRLVDPSVLTARQDRSPNDTPAQRGDPHAVPLGFDAHRSEKCDDGMFGGGVTRWPTVVVSPAIDAVFTMCPEPCRIMTADARIVEQVIDPPRLLYRAPVPEALRQLLCPTRHR